MAVSKERQAMWASAFAAVAGIATNVTNSPFGEFVAYATILAAAIIVTWLTLLKHGSLRLAMATTVILVLGASICCWRATTTYVLAVADRRGSDFRIMDEQEARIGLTVLYCIHALLILAVVLLCRRPLHSALRAATTISGISVILAAAAVFIPDDVTVASLFWMGFAVLASSTAGIIAASRLTSEEPAAPTTAPMSTLDIPRAAQ